MFKKDITSCTMKTITFKLPDELMAVLERRAKQIKGGSRHLLARQLVIDYLNDTRLQSIESELVELRIELDKLRDNLASSILVILLKSGKTYDLKEAQSWVTRTFY